MESKLKDLSKSRNVTTIPPQFHKEPNDATHYDLALANHYVEELVSILESVELIDRDLFKRNHFTLQSIHLKFDCKKKLASVISEFLLISSHTTREQANKSTLTCFYSIGNATRNTKKRALTMVDTNM